MLHFLPPGPKCPRLNSDALIHAKPEIQPPGNDHTEEPKIWMGAVDWEGKAEFKEVAGADIGIRLYAGKKRMFKGHKWERMKEGRDKKRKILMRDMARRVRNYKSYYRKRKPNPLKPSSSAKSRKLPF